jgi:hypothetical protein
MLITMPSTLPADCDEGVYRIWNVAGGFDMYAQGPDNHWEASIIDVSWHRVVIFLQLLRRLRRPKAWPTFGRSSTAC